MNKEEKIEITYNKEPYEFTLLELKELAQKGMNYDKLKSKFEALKEDFTKVKNEGIKLEEIAKSLNLTPEEFLNSLEGEAKEAELIEYSKEKEMPLEYARTIADLEGKIKDLEKEKSEFIPIKKRMEELKDFKKDYPEIDEKDIDPSILKEWEKGERSLKDIYNELTLKKILGEKEARETNLLNDKLSLGSVSGIPERENTYTDEEIRRMSDKEFNRNFKDILKQYRKGDR